ncbi:MAG: RNA polymerase sigma factor, partial [Chloroflexota bacterium]
MTATEVQLAIPADEVLLSQAYAGDERAFEELFARHYVRLVSVALRIVGSHEDAEEIALDAFLRLDERRIDPNAEGANVAGWLYRTTTNAAFNSVRSRKRRWARLRRFALLAVHRSSEVDGPAVQAELKDDAERVSRALAELP